MRILKKIFLFRHAALTLFLLLKSVCEVFSSCGAFMPVSLKRYYQLSAYDKGVVDSAIAVGPHYILKVWLY